MALSACLQCGTPSRSAAATFCVRCGLPYGAPPRATVALPSCPICYRTADDDGRFESLDTAGRRMDLPTHQAEHDRHPVGDDEYLESLREGDKVRIGRWTAPFEVVRRYLVTGLVEAGRQRAFEHNTIVTAMTQLRKWGPDAAIFGDQPDWAAGRSAVSDLMERYHAGRVVVAAPARRFRLG
jgi:hypothetical protein